jgi:hypothetical protein
VLALIEASGLIGSHFSLETQFGKLLFESLLQFCLAAWIATSPRMSRWSHVPANKNVALEFRHTSTLPNRMPPRFKRSTASK